MYLDVKFLSLETENNLKLISFDVSELRKEQEAFESLSDSEKSEAKSFRCMYEKKHGVLTPEKDNYYFYVNEIEERMKRQADVPVLPLELFSLEQSTTDLLKSLENPTRIIDIYKHKKLTVKKSGINNKEAAMIVDCLRQGRNLFIAGKHADLLSKPLIYFYSFVSYVYAAIILNSPMHKSLLSLKNSHGQTYLHKTTAIEFGGNTPWGTFSDLLFSIPTNFIRGDSFVMHYSCLKSFDYFQHNKMNISLMGLMSMVPEIRYFYNALGEEKTLTYPAKVDTEVISSSVNFKFSIGDVHRKPTKDLIEKDFPECAISEENGRWVILVPKEKIKDISPTLYQGSLGEMFYIEKRFADFILPEICLHYLIMASFSCIMRYTPYEWNKLLTNEFSSEETLLIGNYIRIFEQKYPIMLLRLLSDKYPIIQHYIQILDIGSLPKQAL